MDESIEKLRIKTPSMKEHIANPVSYTHLSLVVLDPEQKKVWESRTISNGTFMETAREWERIQDVNKIVEKTREVLEGLLHAYPEVSSIGLTGQMHGILYVDREGRCISPLYTWQDGRGNVPDEMCIRDSGRCVRRLFRIV